MYLIKDARDLGWRDLTIEGALKVLDIINASNVKKAGCLPNQKNIINKRVKTVFLTIFLPFCGSISSGKTKKRKKKDLKIIGNHICQNIARLVTKEFVIKAQTYI